MATPSDTPTTIVTSDKLTFEQALQQCHSKWQGRFQDTANQLEGFYQTLFKIGFDKVPYCAGPIPGIAYNETIPLATMKLIYPWFMQNSFARIARTGDTKSTYITAKTLPYEGFAGDSICWSLTSDDSQARNFVNINEPGKFDKTFAPWKKTISVSMSEPDLEVYRLKDARDKHRLIFSGITNRAPNTPEDEEKILETVEEGKFHSRVKKNKEKPQYADGLRLNVSIEYPNRPAFFNTKVYVRGPHDKFIPVFTNALVQHIAIQAVATLDPWLESNGTYSSCIGLRHVFVVGGASSGPDEILISAQKRFGFQVDVGVSATDVKLLLPSEAGTDNIHANIKRRREDDGDDGIVEMPGAKVPMITQG